MTAQLLSLYWARTPRQRLRGLIGRVPMAVGHGLLIDDCRAVHTFGMNQIQLGWEITGRDLLCVPGELDNPTT